MNFQKPALIAALLCIGLAQSTWAQFPGMQDAEEQTKAPSAVAIQTVQQQVAPAWSKPLDRFRYEWHRLLGEQSPYRGMVLAVLTIVLLTFLYRGSTRRLRQYLQENAYKEENTDSFLRTWRSTWKFVIGVFTVIALSGSLKMLGLSAGFLGMMLGWSLQAPVTGIAAWLMIIAKKPFRIGDRIVLAGYTGDVTDITLTHVILNQVGGSVGGEERSGRGILIPNAILFGHVIINYTLDEKYMLDEVIVRLTFDSDHELAEKLCIATVHEVTPEIIRDTGFEPHVRNELYESGVLLRVRYQTVPANRQEISSKITHRILNAFKGNYEKVRFCYPHSVVRYWPNDSDDAATPPPIK